MAEPESGPVEFFTGDHRGCDLIWADVESAIGKKDAAAAQAAWATFASRLLKHFQMEEEVLFPAFEDATGMRGGPTAMMRHEHGQMRALVEQMKQAASAGNLQSVLDQGDTLLMIIQQHNAKEEHILYPMAERALHPSWAALADKLRAMR